ncbi:hypothetical protein [Nocardia sp. NPDC046763]|uniref:hypothetical protein n=1 Tax=Nocardia sp. NPDC046763 TaxID=3155256 RepID=UPI00340B37AC
MMNAEYKAHSVTEIRAIAATMRDDGSMRIAYIHGDPSHYMIADLPGDLASLVLEVIGQALLNAEQNGATSEGPSAWTVLTTTVNAEVAR